MTGWPDAKEKSLGKNKIKGRQGNYFIHLPISFKLADSFKSLWNVFCSRCGCFGFFVVVYIFFFFHCLPWSVQGPLMRSWEKVDNGCRAPIEEELGRAYCRISLKNLLLKLQCHGQLCKGIHIILMQRLGLKFPYEITVLSQPNNPLCYCFWALMVFRAKTGTWDVSTSLSCYFKSAWGSLWGWVPHLKD